MWAESIAIPINGGDFCHAAIVTRPTKLPIFWPGAHKCPDERLPLYRYAKIRRIHTGRAGTDTDTQIQLQRTDTDTQARVGFARLLVLFVAALWLAWLVLWREGGGKVPGLWERCTAGPPSAATVYWSRSVRPCSSWNVENLCWSNDTNRSAGAQELLDG